jgi:hypothetical protein
MATMTEETDLIVGQLVERSDLADSMLRQTKDLIDSTRDAIAAAIQTITGIDLTLDVSGVDTTYVAVTTAAPAIPTEIAGLDTTYVPSDETTPTIPTEIAGLDTTYVPPTASPPTIPAATGVSIGDAEWDRIFNRAAAQEARAGVAEEYNAQSEGMLRGMAIPSIITNAMVGLAQQRTMDRISSVAETSAIEQAKAAREDILALVKLALEKWVQQWTTQISSEATRRLFEELKKLGVVDLAKLQVDMFKTIVDANTSSEQTRASYETLKVTAVTELAKVQAQVYQIESDANTKSEQVRAVFEKLELDKATMPAIAIAEYDLKRIQLELQNEIGHLVDLVQVYAQMTNGLYSGTNVGLSSSAGYSLGPVVYNPSAGQVVVTPS